MASGDDRRMMPYINPEGLIDQIKQHPLLYNAVLPEYSDRLKKLKVWQEICNVLVPNWKSLQVSDRNLYMKEVQNKWRSIRDSFVKDYRRFKKSEMNGTKPPKRKKYIYYNRLTFLIDSIEKKRFCDIDQKKLITSQDSQSEDEQEQPLQQSSTNLKSPQQPIATKSSDGEILKTLRHLKEKLSPREEDEDRLFLLSLLSYFKKMDDETRMNARIQILHCVHGAMTQMKDKDNLGRSSLDRDTLEDVEIEVDEVKPFDLM